MTTTELPPLSYKKLIKNIGAILVSIFLVSMLVRKGHVTTRELSDWPRHGKLILLAILTQMFMTIASAFRWSWLARYQGQALNDIPRLYAWHHLSQAFGLITLGGLGSDALRWYYMSARADIPKKMGLLITFYDRFFSLAVLGGMIVVVQLYALNYQLVAVSAAVGALLAIHFLKLKKICAISAANHLIRGGLFLYVLSYISPTYLFHLEDLSHINIGLLAEILPVTFEGIGATHWVFDHYFQAPGIEAVQILIVAKIFYRIGGLVFMPMWFFYR